MGGTDDPSNLVDLTVEEHAEAHKKLWEEHGHQEDYLAWKGLSGQIPSKEVVRLALIAASHKRAEMYRGIPMSKETRLKLSLAKKGRPRKLGLNEKDRVAERNAKLFAKQWNIIDSNGNTKTIKNLRNWCQLNNLPKAAYTNLQQKGKWKEFKAFKV